MRTKEYTVTGFALDRDGIAVSANPVAGTPITLLAAAANLSPPRELTVFSASDQSAVNFVVIGKDRNGQVVTETIVGPTAGATVRGRQVYSVITSVISSSSPATATELGWVARTTTPWVICGLGTGVDVVSSARVSVIDLVGAGDGDVEVTYDYPGGYVNGIIRGDTPPVAPKVDETIAVTPLTPVTAQGIMCRFVLTSGASTGATARFARPGII